MDGENNRDPLEEQVIDTLSASLPEQCADVSQEQELLLGSVEKVIPKLLPIPRKPLFLVLSFAIPFLVLSIAYAMHPVYPFGDWQVIVSDSYSQYYPFFSDLWHKLRDGSSMLWSWSAGPGGNYLGIIGYYLASPLNFFIVLFPHEWLREVFTVLILTKVGFAGLFMAVYLRNAFRRCDVSLPMFAVFYALCGFTLGYYWNIMWLDTFALLPLVMTGILALVRESKFILYTCALAMSVLFNYYVGFFACIFTAVWFIAQSFINKLTWREVLRKLGTIAGCSAVALGFTAFLTVPVYLSLQDTYSAQNTFPAVIQWYNSFIDILGNSIAYQPPTKWDGLPNVYTGLPSVVLMGVFIRSRKVSWREKTAYICVLAFILISCNLNVLDYIWHGFHFPRQFPSRFSFLASFTIVVIGYRAYVELDENMRWWDVVAMLVSAAVFITMACLSGFDNVEFSVITVGVYISLLIGRKLSDRVRCPGCGIKLPIIKHMLSATLVLVLLLECFISTRIGVETNGMSTRDTYINRDDVVQELLSMRDPGGFYRTEMGVPNIANDPALYGYNGLSIFASSLNINTNKFLLNIGISGRVSLNRCTYYETTPLFNAFTNVRYIIARANNGFAADKSVYWEPVGEYESGLLLENKRYLPLGFMTNAALADFKGGGITFEAQNELFRLATGLEGDLFTLVELESENHINYTTTTRGIGSFSYAIIDSSVEPADGRLSWSYIAPSNGPLYAFAAIGGVSSIQINMSDGAQRSVTNVLDVTFCMSVYAEGETVVIEGTTNGNSGNAQIYVASIDQDLFDRGYALLVDETLELTLSDDTKIRGTITVKNDGLLYTSIPYEKGWTAYVDGEKQEIITVGGSMAALYLTAGEHTVEFRYINEGLILGIAVTLLSLAVFAYMVFKHKKNRRNKSAQSLQFIQTEAEAPPADPQDNAAGPISAESV